MATLRPHSYDNSATPLLHVWHTCDSTPKLVFFRDTASELRAIDELTDGMHDKRTKLKELQQSLNEARTNETLHFLTMITTLFLPVQVFSAIYGSYFSVLDLFLYLDSFQPHFKVMSIIFFRKMLLERARLDVKRTKA